MSPFQLFIILQFWFYRTFTYLISLVSQHFIPLYAAVNGILFSIYSSDFLFRFYLFIFIQKEREVERERIINVWEKHGSLASHTYPVWDLPTFWTSALTLKWISDFQYLGLMWIPAHGIRVLWQQWTNSNGLQKSCGEKGMAWPLSKWERGREGQREPKRTWPLPGQVFIAFLGTLHQGWSSFTMHKFTVGDYLLQTIKDRMLLITSKEGCYRSRGKVVELVTLHTWEA